MWEPRAHKSLAWDILFITVVTSGQFNSVGVFISRPFSLRPQLMIGNGNAARINREYYGTR